MSEINWHDLFYVNPLTGEASESQFDGFIFASPTYGVYGGAFNPDPSVTLLTDNNQPYSYQELLDVAPKKLNPVDFSDYLYYVHDVQSQNALTTDEQIAADINLITALAARVPENDPTFDPEESFYAGLVITAISAKVIIEGGFVDPSLLIEAGSDIQYGLENFTKQESKSVSKVLGDIFAFDASLTHSQPHGHDDLLLA